MKLYNENARHIAEEFKSVTSSRALFGSILNLNSGDNADSEADLTAASNTNNTNSANRSRQGTLLDRIAHLSVHFDDMFEDLNDDDLYHAASYEHKRNRSLDNIHRLGNRHNHLGHKNRNSFKGHVDRVQSKMSVDADNGIYQVIGIEGDQLTESSQMDTSEINAARNGNESSASEQIHGDNNV